MPDMDLKLCVDHVRRGDEALASGRLDLAGQYAGGLDEFVIEKCANVSLKQVWHSLRRQIQRCAATRLLRYSLLPMQKSTAAGPGRIAAERFQGRGSQDAGISAS